MGPGRYQTEGTQHRQVAHARQAQLHEAEDDDDAVEDIPALLEVVVWVKGDDLEGHLCREDSREDLKREQESAGPEHLAWPASSLLPDSCHASVFPEASW